MPPRRPSRPGSSPTRSSRPCPRRRSSARVEHRHPGGRRTAGPASRAESSRLSADQRRHGGVAARHERGVRARSSTCCRSRGGARPSAVEGAQRARRSSSSTCSCTTSAPATTPPTRRPTARARSASRRCSGCVRARARLNPSWPATAARWPTCRGHNMIKEVFLDSETAIGLISTPPGRIPRRRWCPPKEMTHIRDEINRVTQSRRMLAHGLVSPAARPGRSRLHGAQQAATLKVDAWKAYTGAASQGVRARLVRRRREDRLPDARAGPQARHASASACTKACRWVPVADYNHPRDLIKAAKDFPDIDFLALPRRTAGCEQRPKPTGEVPWTTEFCEMKKKEPGITQHLHGAGLHLRPARHHQPDGVRPSARPGHRRLRRRPRAVGHGLDLVRHAAVADRGLPALRDSRRADRPARLRAAHAAREGADLRPERPRGCSAWTSTPSATRSPRTI
mgnify:CR=1 FL=1